MSPITFHGKTYLSESEMPQDIRQAYQDDQVRRIMAGLLADGRELPSTQDLPKTDELHRPSTPRISSQRCTDETDSSLVIRGLIFGILLSLILAAIVYLVIQFLRQLF